MVVSCFISDYTLCHWQLSVVSESLKTDQLPVISKMILTVGSCFVALSGIVRNQKLS